MAGMNCVIDCRKDSRLDNDFQILNILGNPVFSYITEECLKCDCFDEVLICTDSEYLRYMASNMFEGIGYTDTINTDSSKKTFVVSSRAVFLKRNQIENIVTEYNNCENDVVATHCVAGFSKDDIGNMSDFYQSECNVFCLHGGGSDLPILKVELDEISSIVINTKNDFELAIVLKRKELNSVVLRKAIEDRIEEKKEILSSETISDTVCLVGHSQLDNWDIDEIAGMKVRNAGIRGISSFEYDELILNKGILNCLSNTYIVMHGTNDIVYSYSIEEIVYSIKKTIEYIEQNNENARIIFIPCLHVNGRMDRSNLLIDSLNALIKQTLSGYVEFVDVAEFDDVFGNLNQKYTVDGLHLSEEGYALLEKFVGEVL